MRHARINRELQPARVYGHQADAGAPHVIDFRVATGLEHIAVARNAETSASENGKEGARLRCYRDSARWLHKAEREAILHRPCQLLTL